LIDFLERKCSYGGGMEGATMVETHADMTTAEVAAHFGKGAETVRVWARERRLVPYRKVGNAFLYKRTDVMAFTPPSEEYREFVKARSVEYQRRATERTNQ
jgi:hypothetical protein